MNIPLGTASQAEQEVGPGSTASHLGSGTVRVLATPAMLLMIEELCRKMLEPYLGPGASSVGVAVELRHLAPTPVGERVTVRAEVTAVEDSVITFKALVEDEHELVGEAVHRRAVIDQARFMRRVQAKSGGA